MKAICKKSLSIPFNNNGNSSLRDVKIGESFDYRVWAHDETGTIIYFLMIDFDEFPMVEKKFRISFDDRQTLRDKKIDIILNS